MKLNPIIRALWPYRFMIQDGLWILVKVAIYFTIGLAFITGVGKLAHKGEQLYTCRDGYVHRLSARGDYWINQGNKCVEVKND